jgi:8-oxo-dGTP diphosphatase
MEIDPTTPGFPGSATTGRATDEVVEVAAGLVFRTGRLLITQRCTGDHLGGLWEFPGGKREPGESYEHCLRRELKEELGLEVETVELIESLTHRYPEKTVHLQFYRCRCDSGEAQLLGCQAAAWVTAAELSGYEFPPADARLLDLLRKRGELWGSSGQSNCRTR